MVNSKISGLAGTGTRMVVADASGNLSTIQRLNTVNVTGLTTSYQLIAISPAYLSYIWAFSSSADISSSNKATLESTHNIFHNNSIYSKFSGATVTEITPDTEYSFRLGDSVVGIKIEVGSGSVYLKRISGTVTDLKIERITQNIYKCKNGNIKRSYKSIERNNRKIHQS